MAGCGIQIWPLSQDIHQLRTTDGQRAGVLQVFGIDGHDSTRLVSDLLGEETVSFQTISQALDGEKSWLFFFGQHTGRSLPAPYEVRVPPQNRELPLPAGLRPIAAA